MFDSVEQPSSLLDRFAAGDVSMATIDSWQLLHTTADRDPEALAEALQMAAAINASAFTSLAPRAGFGLAVVGLDHRCHYADSRFRAWFGNPGDSPALRRLTHQAARQGQASGLVDDLDGSAMAACAAGPQAAGAWPLPPEVLEIAAAGSRRIVLICFAPSRDKSLALEAAGMLGLTPLESRLAEAMLDAPTVQVAAERIGVGYETAREALGKIKKRLGVKRTSDIVRRLMTLMCGDIFLEPDLKPLMAKVLGATPAEARVGALTAEGLSAPQIAAELGVREATIRGQLKALYAKAGVGRARDLVRIVTEAGALVTMTHGAETALQPESLSGRLRVIQTRDGRQAAYWDYGPRGSRPILILHGSITGRTLPPAFVAMMHAKGWRPIVPQRPGFGLSDTHQGDYFTTCADDMADMLDALRLSQVRIAARDDGAGAALTFAERYPGRVSDAILLRPNASGTRQVRSANTVTGAVKRLFYTQPDLITLIAELMRRQNSTHLLRETILRSAQPIAADQRAISEPTVMTSLIRDCQAMSARTIRGFATEQSLFARGWTPPRQVGGASWRIIEFPEMPMPGIEAVFGYLPGVSFGELPEAGLFPYYSHPEQVAGLLTL
ncbi:MAG: alpha/beta fold hydrolase [Caulobacter sp.]|nr:alpha/beta fold hydrolase [Caulobacter sp.]